MLVPLAAKSSRSICGRRCIKFASGNRVPGGVVNHQVVDELTARGPNVQDSLGRVSAPKLRERVFEAHATARLLAPGSNSVAAEVVACSNPGTFLAGHCMITFGIEFVGTRVRLGSRGMATLGTWSGHIKTSSEPKRQGPLRVCEALELAIRRLNQVPARSGTACTSETGLSTAIRRSFEPGAELRKTALSQAP